MPPEAQFQDELYRALHLVTGGKCNIHSEFSYTSRGRLDFFLKKKQWGIEVMREGDRLQNHIERFEPQGAYGSWSLVKDWVILDFRHTQPPASEQRGKKHFQRIWIIFLLIYLQMTQTSTLSFSTPRWSRMKFSMGAIRLWCLKPEFFIYDGTTSSRISSLLLIFQPCLMPLDFALHECCFAFFHVCVS